MLKKIPSPEMMKLLIILDLFCSIVMLSTEMSVNSSRKSGNYARSLKRVHRKCDAARSRGR